MKVADFIDSIGVVAHLSYTDSAYAKGASALSALKYLGIDHVRVSAVQAKQPGARTYDLFANAGVQFDMVAQGTRAPTEIAARAEQFVRRHPGAIAAIEGPNEINNFPISYGGLTGADAGLAFDADLVAAIGANPWLAAVDSYSFTGYRVDDVADFTSFHPYARSADQPFTFLSRNPFLTDARDKPLVITETGWHTAPTSVGQWEGVDQLTQAKFTLNLLFDAQRLGIEATYLYQLVDAYPDPTGTSIDNNLGLFTKNYAPKAAAKAIHNLTTILASDSGTFSVPDFAYSLDGLPETGASMILEKPSGVRDIVVWAEPDIWDEVLHTPIAASPSAVTVHLGDTPVDVRVFDPLNGTSTISSHRGVTSVSITVTDHPVIIEVARIGSWSEGIGQADTSLYLAGRSHDDVITGGNNDDYLRGGSGSDSIDGGDGDDVIQGDNGADVLTGGGGADIFLYTKINDSRAAASAQDIILDFSALQGDRIQLSGIDAARGAGDQSFVLGSDHFSGHAGEVIQTVTAGDLSIMADVDGDGAAEWMIKLQGVTMPLGADSFLL